MDPHANWEKMTQEELHAAWVKWWEVYQTAHDRVYCDHCRDQHAFCDCGTRMAYLYLERDHLAKKENKMQLVHIVAEKTSTGYSLYVEEIPGVVATAGTLTAGLRELAAAIDLHEEGSK